MAQGVVVVAIWDEAAKMMVYSAGIVCNKEEKHRHAKTHWDLPSHYGTIGRRVDFYLSSEMTFTVHSDSICNPYGKEMVSELPLTSDIASDETLVAMLDVAFAVAFPAEYAKHCNQRDRGYEGEDPITREGRLSAERGY